MDLSYTDLPPHHKVSEIAEIDQQEKGPFNPFDRQSFADNQCYQDQATCQDDHQDVNVGRHLKIKWSNNSTDAKDPEQVEDVGPDDVAHSDIGISLVGGDDRGDEFGEAGADGDDG